MKRPRAPAPPLQPDAVAIAVFRGAIAGGVITALGLLLPFAPDAVGVGLNVGPGLGVAMLAGLFLLYAVPATLVWGVGLALVGLPIWLLLRRFNVRSARAAALLGSLSSFVAVAALYSFELTLLPLWLGVAAAGAIVGVVVQRTVGGYAPTTIPPALPQ